MDTKILELIAYISKSLDWSAWVQAIATIVLAILTFIYVRLTKRIIEAQSEPRVILSVIHDEARSSILQLVVRNVGSGLAQDISFQFSRPIPHRAFGISIDQAKTAEEMKDGPLIDGIPALGPGEERRIDWGQYGGLVKNLGGEPVIVKCMFKKNGKKMPPVECKLDVKSFKGIVAAEVPIAKIARDIEEISNNLKLLLTIFDKLKVEIVEPLKPDTKEKEDEKA
jgi:hypothetical protein